MEDIKISAERSLAFYPLKRRFLSLLIITVLIAVFLYFVFSFSFPNTSDLYNKIIYIGILLFFSMFFLNIFTDAIMRKIIITKTHIFDNKGIFHKSNKYLLKSVKDCYLEKNLCQGVHSLFNDYFSLDGRSTVLILEGKEKKKIGQLNLGQFSKKDQEKIIALIWGKPIDKSFRIVTNYVDAGAV